MLQDAGIAAGDDVVTMDGALVGKITALTESRFLVQGGGWIDKETVWTAAVGKVTLICNLSRLAEYTSAR